MRQKTVFIKADERRNLGKSEKKLFHKGHESNKYKEKRQKTVFIKRMNAEIWEKSEEKLFS